ncbi:MAG: hypothetical protein HY000_36300 [Planctomycetes bacterium]|nr:hypothetical protein [Planctomycetota bacterium]
MNRFTALLAATALVVFAVGGVALAGGGHHHHGHGHHSGFHVGHSGFHAGFGLGHGFHDYGHHHHYSYSHYGYPSYGHYHYSYPSYYSYYPSYYGYPSYSTYSYYGYPTYCSPSVIYSSPSGPGYAPAQRLDQPYQQRRVEPTPPAVPQPSQALPNGGSPRSSDTGTQFTTLRREPNGRQPSSTPVQGGAAFETVAPFTQLGPQLAVPSVRHVLSDEERPWAIEDAPVAQREVVDTAVTSEAVAPSAPAVSTEEGRRTAASALGLAIPSSMRGIAQLSPADQRAALAQRTCPVTGDLLGANGKPVKVRLAGREVFVCCDDCVKDLKATP